MNLIRPFLVMSAYTKDNTPEANKLRHKALLSQLQKYPKFSIREVDGQFLFIGIKISRRSFNRSVFNIIKKAICM